MKLTVLGKYGPYPKADGATSSYLINANGVNILLDMGAGSFSRLVKILSPEKIDIIIFSHFHFDHCSDFGVLGYYYQRLVAEGYNRRPKVFCPSQGGILAETVINNPNFAVKTVKGGDVIEESGIKFEFFDMNHPVSCVGVKIFDGNKTFAYTGDTNLTDNLDFLYSGTDLVLADGAFLLKDWSEKRPHLSVSHIVELTKKWGNKSIISHINPNYDESLIKEEIGEANCTVAEEGRFYEI